MSGHAPAEALKESPEKGKEHGGEKKPDATKKVEAGTKDIHDKIEHAVPHVAKPPECEDDNDKRQIFKYKSLPYLPSARTTLKAGAAVLTVASPYIGVPVVASAWTWSKINKYPPFSWAQKGVSKAIHVAKDAASAVAEVVTWPVRMPAVLGYNVVAGGINTVGAIGGKVKDVLVDTPGESKHLIEQAFDFVKSLPRRAADRAGQITDLAIDFGKFFVKHPIRASVAAAIIVSLVTQPTVVVGAVGEVSQLLIDILKRLATRP